jgi:hypothetical protein
MGIFVADERGQAPDQRTPLVEIDAVPWRALENYRHFMSSGRGTCGIGSSSNALA